MPKGIPGSKDWAEPKRVYYKYWKALKEARLNKTKVAKIIHIKVPVSLIPRVIKGVIKEKDLDWNFKADNSHDPYRLNYKHEILEGDIAVLTIWIDRRSDL